MATNTGTMFLLLKQAMRGPPDGAAHKAVDQLITQAEGIVQGRADSKEVEVLLQAKQMLTCDPLHIPLRQSLAQLERLQREIARGSKPAGNEFSVLIDSLNRALGYGLRRLVELQQG